MSQIKTVLIPIVQENNQLSLTLNLQWQCPVCGAPRGAITMHSLNGKPVSHWLNPCGHNENDPHRVLDEAIKNNLNKGLKRA